MFHFVKQILLWQTLIGVVVINGSFDFNEVLALFGGVKANVPFVQMCTIVFKNCALGK
jgi:hypothetical protein